MKRRKPKKPVVDFMLEALRHELRGLVNRPLDAGSLHRIGMVAAAAGQLLMARDPRQKLNRNGSNGTYGNTAYVTSGSGLMLPTPIQSSSDDDSSESSMSAAQASGPETYGAKLLRELMANIGPLTAAMRDTPSALVMALADARRHGLDDVAAVLERRLGVEHVLVEGKSNGKRRRRGPVGPVPRLGDFPLMKPSDLAVGAIGGVNALVAPSNPSV